MAIGRNDPCPCGSGKKYKKCCATKQEQPLELEPAIRMKGGVAFDPKADAFRAIVHSWDNPDCEGEPDEWLSEQAFQSEDDAMSFYKMNIRPKLERFMREAAHGEGVDVTMRRLE